MEKLKTELQLALDDVLFDLGVQSHLSKRNDTTGDEYVIYHIISMPFTEFANDKPIFQEQNVDINYYAVGKPITQENIQLIKDKMSRDDWKLTTGEERILGLPDDINGLHLEFVRGVVCG